MGSKIRMDKIFSKLQKLWRNRRWADGIRVEHLRQSHRSTEQIRRNTRKFHRKNSIYVDVQRYFLWNKRQWRRMSGKCSTRIFVSKKIAKRTVVIHWSWFWEKVVLYQWRQSTRNLGQNCRKDVDWIRGKRMSNFPCYKSIVQRSTQKQRTLLVVASLCSRSENNWDYFSHNCLCKSAQSLRSSDRKCVKNLKPFTIDRRDLMWWWDNQLCLVQSSTSSFGEWWSSISDFPITIIWRTNWEAITTRQIE